MILHALAYEYATIVVHLEVTTMFENCILKIGILGNKLFLLNRNIKVL